MPPILIMREIKCCIGLWYNRVRTVMYIAFFWYYMVMRSIVTGRILIPSKCCYIFNWIHPSNKSSICCSRSIYSYQSKGIKIIWIRRKNHRGRRSFGIACFVRVTYAASRCYCRCDNCWPRIDSQECKNLSANIRNPICEANSNCTAASATASVTTRNRICVRIEKLLFIFT